MNKIPVGKTIAYAYNFTFSHLGTIIGLAWLPLVILTVLNFLPELAGNAPDAATGAPLSRLSGGIGNLAILMLSLLLYAIIYVAVTRQALGLRQGTASVHFALGLPEYRVFGALLLLISLAIAAVFAGSLVIGLFFMSGLPAMQVAAAVISIVALFAFVFGLVRLSFLLVPVTVVEGRIDLARGWVLTENNFWRIFAVMLAVAVPIGLIFLVGEFLLVGGELMVPIPPKMLNDSVALVDHFSQIFGRHAPELLGLQLVLAPFTIGLERGAAAFAYRSLVKDLPPAATA